MYENDTCPTIYKPNDDESEFVITSEDKINYDVETIIQVST